MRKKQPTKEELLALNTQLQEQVDLLKKEIIKLNDDIKFERQSSTKEVQSILDSIGRVVFQHVNGHGLSVLRPSTIDTKYSYTDIIFRIGYLKAYAGEYVTLRDTLIPKEEVNGILSDLNKNNTHD